MVASDRTAADNQDLWVGVPTGVSAGIVLDRLANPECNQANRRVTLIEACCKPTTSMMSLEEPWLEEEAQHTLIAIPVGVCGVEA